MKLIDNSGVSKTENGESTIVLGKEVADNYWHCLMLPQGCSRRERMEAIGTLYSEMMQNESLEIPMYKGRTTESNIPIEYALALRGIGRVLGYLINSTSWKQGVLEEYDREELLKRIKQIPFNN